MGPATRRSALLLLATLAAPHAQAAPVMPGPDPGPAHLRMSLPAICDPDHPRAGQDGMGRVLRNLFDGLEEWQCGWRTSQPHWSDWNLTLWGGAMTDGNLGQSLRLEKGWRSEGLGGVGVQGRIWKRGRIGLVVDANLIGHQAVDGATTPGQSFGEGTIGLGLKLYPSRWLSLTVVEGLSVYTSRSKLQRQRGGNGRRLVNYLAFEADAALNRRWSVVGRVHHRSGVYGTLDCIKACDNNAYLLGLRYRFATAQADAAQSVEPSEQQDLDLDLEQEQDVEQTAEDEADSLQPDANIAEQKYSNDQVTSHDVGSDPYR